MAGQGGPLAGRIEFECVVQCILKGGTQMAQSYKARPDLFKPSLKKSKRHCRLNAIFYCRTIIGSNAGRWVTGIGECGN